MQKCLKKTNIFFFSVHIIVWFYSFKPGILLMGHYKANSIAPDVTPEIAAYHLGLFCLLIRISSKKDIKNENHTCNTKKNGPGLSQC